jgi:hypothetical protein
MRPDPSFVKFVSIFRRSFERLLLSHWPEKFISLFCSPFRLGILWRRVHSIPSPRLLARGDRLQEA